MSMAKAAVAVVVEAEEEENSVSQLGELSLHSPHELRSSEKKMHASRSSGKSEMNKSAMTAMGDMVNLFKPRAGQALPLDPEAVPIPPPQSRYPQHSARQHTDLDFTERQYASTKRKPRVGGVRPLNTLGKGASPTNTYGRQPSRPFRGLLSSNMNSSLHPEILQHSLRYPDDSLVQFPTSARGRRADIARPTTEPSRKRPSPTLDEEDGTRKRQRATPPRTSPQVVNVDSPEDELSHGSARIPLRTSSQHSQTRLSTNGTRPLLHRGNSHQTTEYQAVEDRLNSNGYIARHSRRNREPQRNIASFESRESDVQFVSENQVPRVEIADAVSAENERMHRAAIYKMPGSFPEDGATEEEVQEVQETKPKTVKSKFFASDTALTPANNANDCSAHIDESPDELGDAVKPRALDASGARVSNTRGVRPTGTRQSLAAAHDNPFEKPRRRLSHHSNGQQVSLDQNSSPKTPHQLKGWSGKVGAYIHRAIYDYQDHRDDTKPMAILLSYEDGISVARADTKPRIVLHTNKVVKICFHNVEAQNLIVRLETSRSGNDDNQFYFAFHDIPGYEKFVTQVARISRAKVVQVDANHLESALQKRLLQLPKLQAQRKQRVSDDVGRESSPTGTKRAHQEAISAADGESSESASKRRRGERELEAGASTVNGATTKAKGRHHKYGDIDNILEQIAGGSRNANRIDALPRASRRQTRSLVSNPPTESKADEIPAVLQELSDSERYSRTHGLGKPWKYPLVYPPDAKRKATVIFEDLERLDNGQFLNDNLIDFYLKYLLSESPNVAKSVYVFNTFFFEKLTSTERGQRINYDAVKRWTRGVDIFDHDFVIVPINESAHWYLAIICNLPALKRKMPSFDDEPEDEDAEKGRDQKMTEAYIEEEDAIVEVPALGEDNGQRDAAKSKILHDENKNPLSLASPTEMLKFDEEDNAKAERHEEERLKAKESCGGRRHSSSPSSARKRKPPTHKVDPDEPAIMVLDSMGIQHPVTIRVLKDYLISEAAEKRGGMEIDRKDIKGLTAKGIPQQENFSDCGVFLLGYMDKFMEDPRGFATRMLQRDFDAELDWPHLVPTDMRANVRDLVQKLHADQESNKKESKKKQQLPRASDASPNVSKTLPPQQPEPGKGHSRPGSGDSKSGNKAHDATIKGYADTVSPDGGERAAASVRERDVPPTIEPSLEVPRTPEQRASLAEPQEEILMTEEVEADVVCGAEAVPTTRRDARPGSAKTSPVRGPHDVMVPDSQESSFYDQLQKAAGGEGQRPQSPEPADISRVRSSPARPRTRGKPAVSPAAELRSISPPRQRKLDRRRARTEPEHVIELIDD